MIDKSINLFWHGPQVRLDSQKILAISKSFYGHLINLDRDRDLCQESRHLVPDTKKKVSIKLKFRCPGLKSQYFTTNLDKSWLFSKYWLDVVSLLKEIIDS